MAAKQKSSKNGAMIVKLEKKLAKAKRLNHILMAVCAVLLIACIVLAIQLGNAGKDPADTTDTPTVSTADTPSPLTGTYQYYSEDNTYGIAIEFGEDSSVWFYEATSDSSFQQGFIGELQTVSASDGTTPGLYTIPFYYVDGSYYQTSDIQIIPLGTNLIGIIQTNPEALLSERLPTDEAIVLSPVVGASVKDLIINLYADQMAG